MYKNVHNCDVRAHGLIFYNGPTRATRDAGGGGGLADYIVLELHGGYPVLRINHGSGEAKLEIDGRDAQRRRRLEPLNDGRWHSAKTVTRRWRSSPPSTSTVQVSARSRWFIRCMPAH